MTRTYALKRLLEHGPMTALEIHECTRWPTDTVRRALDELLVQGVVRRRQCAQGRTGYAYVAVGV